MLPLLLSAPVASLSWSAASDQSFTYQGRFMNEDGTAPLSGTIDVTFAIFEPNPAGTCLLYEETQAGIDLDASDGYVSLYVGSAQGAARRTARDPGKSMAQIFSNRSEIRASGSPDCADGYTPQVNDGRRLHVIVKPHAGAPVALSPDLEITGAPMAAVAQSLQGFGPADFLKTSTNATQLNIEALVGGANASSLHKHDDLYAKLGELGGKGLNLAGVGAGVGDGKSLRWDATAEEWVTYTPVAGGGTVTQVTGTSPVVVTNGTTTPSISVGYAGAAAAGILSAADYQTFSGKQSSSLTSGYFWVGNGSNTATAVQLSGDATLANDGALTLKDTGAAGTYTKVTTDAKGRVTSGASLALGDLPRGSAGNIGFPLLSQGAGGDVAFGALDLSSTAVTGLPDCQDSSGNHLNYNSTTKAFSCGSSSSAGGEWSAVAGGIAYSGGNVGIGTATPGTKLEIVGTSGTTLKIVDGNQGGGKVLTSDANGVASWADAPSAPVTTVAGRTGAVTLSNTDISGLGTAATLDVGTGANNVVQLNGSSQLPAIDGSLLTGINASKLSGSSVSISGAGAGDYLRHNGTDWVNATLATADVQTALGAASGTNSGYLSSADWTAFNKPTSLLNTGGTASQWLSGISAAGAPTYSQPAFSDISGTLGVAQGGTGATSLTAHGVLVGNGTGTLATTGVGTAGQVLTSNGPGADPTWQALSGGQWGTGASSSINYMAGNVGIGTAEPASRLSVGDGTAAEQAVSIDGGVRSVLDFKKSGASRWKLVMNYPSGTSNELAFVDVGNNLVRMLLKTDGTMSMGGAGSAVYVQNDGNVGVGTTTPGTKLEIVGTSGTTLKIVDGNQGNGKVLTSDGNGVASWADAPSAPVTTVAGRTGAVTLSNTDISGLGTAATLDVGTGANNIVQLNGSSQLPAVDGSLLTGINASKLSGSSVSISGAGAGDYLRHNGTDWVNATLATADVQTALGAASGTNSGYLSSADWTAFNKTTSLLNTGGTASQWLSGISAAGAPTYSQPAFSDISGTLGVAQGGTGATSLTAHGVLVGNGTGTLATTGVGTAGQVLTSNGPGADPTWQAISGGQWSTGASSSINYTAGNVGIGTTTPQQALEVSGSVGIGSNFDTTTALAKLDVRGTIGAESGTAVPNGIVAIGNPISDTQMMSIGVAGGASRYAWIQSRNNNAATFNPLALNPSGGNVGIGTAAPNGNLEIHAPAGANPTMYFSDADVTHGMTGIVPTTNIIGAFGTGDVNGTGFRIKGLTGSNLVSALQLDAYTSASPTTPAVVISGRKKSLTNAVDLAADETLFQLRNGITPVVTTLGSGHFGIGTTTPAVTLHTKAANAASENARFENHDSAYAVHIDNDNGAINSIAIAAGAKPGDNACDTNSPAWRMNLNGFSDVFSIMRAPCPTAGLGSAPEEFFRISGSGNVGIGTSTPGTKLEVVGTSGATLKIVDGNQGNGKVLTSDVNGVASWADAPSAPVSTVAGRTGAVTLSNTDISGLGTAATLNVGTGANNVVQLNGSSQLPAIDGSLLTGVNASKLSGSSVSISGAGAGDYLRHNGTDWVNATLATADVQTALGAASGTNSGYLSSADWTAFNKATSLLNTGGVASRWLSSVSAAGAPTYSQPAFTDISGTLGVAQGGTGATTLTAHGVLVGNDTGAVSATGVGTAGQVLTSNGPGADPTWQELSGGQWSTGASSSINYMAGNVGIGTSTPAYLLDVNGATRIGAVHTLNSWSATFPFAASSTDNSSTFKITQVKGPANTVNNFGLDLTITDTTVGTGGLGLIKANLDGTGTGSGTKFLMDLQTAGASKFYVRRDGNVGIGTNSPRVPLEVAGDGAVLATGTVSAGWTEPNLGAGARMLWYPRKAAFRAGAVSGTEWNDGSIGLNSVALGVDVTASGAHSVALGNTASSTGAQSFAAGTMAQATSSNAIALATNRATASGGFSVAIGGFLTASGSSSFVLGKGIDTTTRLANSTPNSLAIGFNSDVPTLFVGASAGVGTTGNVGIGTASPGTKLEVVGTSGTTLKIVDGNQGNGKVLTSDADGVASWADAPSAPVTSVAGRTGAVTLSTSDISGLGAAATSAAGNLTETTSSVLTITGGAGSVLGTGTTIAVKQAGSGQGGYLSSADWTTFNSKEPAITAGTSSQYLKGDKSLGSFNTDVRAALSGTGPITYSPTSGAISMTDQGTTTTVLHGNASGNPAFSAIVEADLGLTDVVTANASTLKHGFLPKLSGNATDFLKGDGTWGTTPAAPDLTTSVNFGTAAAGTVTLGTSSQDTVINGDVGIGTTNPLQPLHVVGGTPRFQSTNGAQAILIDGAGGGYDASVLLGNGGTTKGKIYYKHANTAITITDATNSDLLTLKGGNVGIGTATPANALSVSGGISAGAYATTATAAGNIVTTGKVGIGQSSPAYSLDIYGGTLGAYATSSATDATPTVGAALGVANANSMAGAPALVQLASWNGNGVYQHAYLGLVANGGATTYGPNLVFGQQDGANSYKERMRINGSGNVGIGTASPGTKLEVVGTSGTTLKIVDGNQGNGKVLTSDADGVASWADAPSAPVASVAGRTGAVTLSNTDISGLGTAATLNTGTGADNVLKLNASSQIPAVDGSLLTGVNASKLSGSSLNIAAPGAGDYLRHNGTDWVNTALATADVQTALGVASGTNSGYLASVDWTAFNKCTSLLNTGGTASRWLSSISAAGAPTYSQPAFSDISGTLGVAQGGTGATTLTAHGVLLGNGTGAVAATGVGTAGQVLTSNGPGADPTWQAVSGDSLWALGASSSVNYTAGSVGIGTAAPSVALHVKSAGAGTGTFRIEDSWLPQLDFYDDTVREGYIGTNGDDMAVKSVSGGLYLGSRDVGGAISILSGGNVGIGTMAPAGILDVNGGTASAGVAGTNISLTAQAGGAGSVAGGNINLTAGAPTGTAIGGNVVLTAGGAATTTSGIVYLKSRTAINTGGTAVTTPWTSIEHSSGAPYSGTLNIFHPTDTYRGAIHTGSYGGGDYQYAIIGQRQNSSNWNGLGGAVTNGDTLPGIGFAGQTVTGNFNKMVLGAAVQGVVDGAVSDLVLPTGIKFSTTTTNTAGVTEQMRLSSAGELGIKTSTPKATLDVNGTARLARYAAAPHACDADRDGVLAATSKYTLCICKNGTGWVSTNDGATGCTWN